MAVGLQRCHGWNGQRCGRLVEHDIRCDHHRGMANRARMVAQGRRRPGMARDTTRRAQVVATHRATHGDVCPGWRRPAHLANTLTADHVHEVSAGGSETGPLSVLCNSCNAVKANDHAASR